MSPEVLKLPVLRVRQPIGDFFLATIAAKDLVEISYSDVRRLVTDHRDLERYLGIQRPVSASRIKKMKKYIEGPDATFPTSIIVSIDERCASLHETKNNQSILTLKPFIPTDEIEGEAIPFDRIAKVIDGQHRIAAFMNDDNQLFEFAEVNFDLNLAIFIGADVSEQANIFATVNLEQTKVNRSLVYDLTELANSRSPHKTCHNIAVVLDSEETSPLFHRIKRLGTATPGRKYEPLTQAAFVEALVKFISINPVKDRNDILEGKKLSKANIEELKKCPFRNIFIDKKDLDIAEILYNYFDAVRDKWPNSWNEIKPSGNLLPKSNAFKALMRFLKDDVYPNIVGDDFGLIPKKKDFAQFFKPLKITDRDFTTKYFAPGSGGQATFYRMLQQKITREEMISEN